MVIGAGSTSMAFVYGRRLLPDHNSADRQHRHRGWSCMHHHGAKSRIYIRLRMPAQRMRTIRIGEASITLPRPQ
jgi:hypothetical protein